LTVTAIAPELDPVEIAGAVVEADDGSRVDLPEVLAAGVEQLAHASGLGPPPIGPVPTPVPRSLTVEYAEDPGLSIPGETMPPRHVFVRTMAVDDDTERLVRYALSSAGVLEQVTVRSSADAWLLEQGDSQHLLWREVPGVLVVIDALGLDLDELLAAAETLREATDEELDALGIGGAPAVEASGPNRPAVTLYGELTDGTPFEVVFSEDHTICSEVRGSEPHCGAYAFLDISSGNEPAVSVFGYFGQQLESDDVLFFGWTSLQNPSPFELTAEHLDGTNDSTTAPFEVIVAHANDGNAAFAVVVPAGSQPPDVVVLRDRQTGEELARGDVSIFEDPEPIDILGD
jgi:hypothetical protein